MKMKEGKKFQVITNAFMMLLSIACIMPFILLIVSSITDENSLIKNGYSYLPDKISFAAYTYLWGEASTIFRAYGITILVTIIGTVLSLIVTSMLAYPLSRKDMPLRKPLTFIVFFTMLFNGGLVPTYLIYTQGLHIKNTIFALIVPGLLMNAFNVMLMRTFFITSIPDAVIESAKVDGASEFKIFVKIILPLSLPILATVGLFEGIAYWNDWYNGLIYITNPNLYSIQNILNRIITDAQFLSSGTLGTQVTGAAVNVPNTAVRMAIAVIAVIPVLIAYPFFQKYFAKGITVGAVKG
jgi:putative aldouronate transport system permease protein